MEAYQTVSNTITTIKGMQDNVAYHHKIWFKQARELAKKLGVSLKAPRTVKIQGNRDNTPANYVEDYYRATVSVKCLDEVCYISIITL